MIARPSKRTALIGGGVIAVLVVGTVSVIALSGNDTKKVTAQPSSTPSPSASAKPTPKPTPAKKPAPAPVNPLTGLGKPPAGPVLAVKIDDTENGRPSVGLSQADVVYIEQAEGGLTRLVAVFGTHKPTVEPVRSVRASDAELLSQYGPIHLVASGGGGDSLTTLDHSIVKGIINDRGAAGFGRDNNRPAPYNLTANLAQMAASAKTGPSKNVGFTWSAKYPLLASAKSIGAVNTVVGSTGVSFVWDARLNRYVRTIAGQRVVYSDGNQAATTNVLVQLCAVTTNPNDVDVMGNPSQFTHSIGRGKAVLFRNGKRIVGTWSRPNASSATTFRGPDGKPMLFAPGGAYVVLATNGAPV
ncbi:MAG: hypothetical protein QOK10_1645 [Pseudonocardiales bacterium]|jgi:hypothetical protein|nr:hypothetical protein [Pseudonocardiales bacterium]